MKILTVGDLHGKVELVRRAYNKFMAEDYDKLIFMGNYVDSKCLPIQSEIDCLTEVGRLSRGYPDEIIALSGRHDIFAYVLGFVRYPEYNAPSAFTFKTLFENGDFRVAWQHKNWIFTNRGITEGWYKNNILMLNEIRKTFKEGNEKPTLAALLNRAVYLSKHQILMQTSYGIQGYHQFGGPVRATNQEILENMLPGYNQVISGERVDTKTSYYLRNSEAHLVNCLNMAKSDNENFITLEI